jgi:D-alanine transfer protein
MMMDRQHQPLEQTPHLAPALTALILGVVVLEAFGFYARSLEYRSINAIAADQAVIERDDRLAPIKNQGTALQQAALDTDGLLPFYGSSEMVLHAAYNRPFHATNLFRDQPTGFTVFPMGKAQTTCLIMLQKLAALGPALDGRKIAISVSAAWFFDRPMAWPDGYAGNFSALHAGALAFNTHLSLALRQDAARRMLRYPETVADRPLLRFALANLADGSPVSMACYQAVIPLGFVHNALLGFVDHLNVVAYLWKHPRMTKSQVSAGGSRPLDWPILHRQADALYRAHSNNNEFGLDNEQWDRRLRQSMIEEGNTRSDEGFLGTLESNQEWVDLELLLRELTELGARPLVLSMPIHGAWYDRLGITYAARRAYYQKLRATGARYQTPVVDFADHDGDRSFCHDNMGHLAPNGLLFYGRILDGFFHDEIPRQPDLSAFAPVAESGSDAGLSGRPTPDSQPPREGSSPRLVPQGGDTTRRAIGSAPNQPSRGEK